MVKCEVCGERVETLFLDKISGTYIKKGKKLKAFCSNCQRKLGNKLKEEI